MSSSATCAGCWSAPPPVRSRRSTPMPTRSSHASGRTEMTTHAPATRAPAPRTEPVRPRAAGRAPAEPRPLVGWLFIAPNLFGVLLFTFIPLASVVALSFTEWNLVSGFEGIEFVGLDNFWFVLQDPTFWRSLLITIAYAGVRSEERRVGKEWRSRRSRSDEETGC